MSIHSLLSELSQYLNRFSDLILFFFMHSPNIVHLWFQSLLSMQSAKEKENKKLNEEILQLLSKPTAKVEAATQCCFCLSYISAKIPGFTEAQIYQMIILIPAIMCVVNTELFS